MIHVKDLRVDYDNVCAVHDLSFDVGPGEVCGLIGPNGAGKTTTMRAMLGLIEPTYGEITMCGVDMRENPRDANRLVGFMPDFPPLYDDLKCWEFLDLFAASYGMPKPERPYAISKLLDVVGLTEKHDSMIIELSRGMRQRLMLAKTLIPDPKILILDEPASGVDPQGRIDLKNVIKAEASRGRAVILSSHILTEMSEFCTSIAIMQRGRMVVNGRIDEISARVMGAATLTVEVLDGSSRFLEIVSGDERAGAVERIGATTYQFRFNGDAVASAALLSNLIGNGISIAAFAPKREGLEDLFLKIGAKEVS
ncbi:MAG: ABC transporter ATP-binding protein [Isosphaeraceae bacterium]|nr:ABC transporter ATP-binding protein [Isosphaeraceae bacterium]